MQLRKIKSVIQKLIAQGAVIAAVVLSINSNAGAQLIAADSTPTSVTLHWTAPGDDGNYGTAAAYDLRYSLSMINDANWNSATQAVNEPAPQPAGSAETFTVTGLQPGTIYYFAIKTADDAGNISGLSNVAVISTAPEQVPPADVSDLAAADPSVNSITLTWTAPGDDDDTGTADEYDIRYSTSMINNNNWLNATQVNNEPSPQPAGSQESFTLSGLQNGTTYYFAIKTADEVPNWSGLSNIASLATLPANIPPGAITDLQFNDINQNSVSLTWTAPGSDGDQGQASEYDVRYSTSPISESNWDSAIQANNEPDPSPSGTEENFTVDGLQAEARYYFAIKTADEVPNWSDLSNVVSAVTPDQTPPGAIDDLGSADRGQ